MKNMDKHYKRMLRLMAAILFISGFAVALFTPASRAASKKNNKAFMAKVSFTETTQAADANDAASQTDITKDLSANSYTLATRIDGPIQLKRKMYLSAKIYIQKQLLKKEGDKVNLLPLLLCKCTNCPITYEIWGKYAVVASKTSGKVKLNLYDTKSKAVKTGKMAGLTSKGKYYILSLNNYPLNTKTHEETGIIKSINVPASGSYTTDILISLTGRGSGYKGPMYIDDLILSAKKVTKIHYDKKDYKKIYGFRTYSGKKITVKTAPVK